MQAARELVAEQGAEVSMDAIAARAGVAVGTLYRHHPTKADLVAAIVDESVEQLAADAERGAAAVTAGADPRDTLTALFARVAARHASDNAVKEAAARLGHVVPDPSGLHAGSSAARAATAIEAVLAAARQAGQVRADLTLTDLTLLLSVVPADADARDRYVQIVMAGIAAA